MYVCVSGNRVPSRLWSAGQEKRMFPVPDHLIWSREIGFAVQSRISPLVLYNQTESSAYSRALILPPAFHDGVNLYRQPQSSPVPSVSAHAIGYQWRSSPRVHRHKASSPQGGSSIGCYLLRQPGGRFLDGYFYITITGSGVWSAMFCATYHPVRTKSIGIT